MKLSNKEIADLIKDHAFFHEKYIEKDCVVCFKHRQQSNYMLLEEFNKTKRMGISPDREKFFESIAEKNKNLLDKIKDPIISYEEKQVYRLKLEKLPKNSNPNMINDEVSSATPETTEEIEE